MPPISDMPLPIANCRRNGLPESGTILISVNDYDKSSGLKLARDLYRMGFQLIATREPLRFSKRLGCR